MSDAKKAEIAARSESRPAISVAELLQVARRSARARACTGMSEFGGVGGGVASVSCAISAVGVAGTIADVEARREIAGRRDGEEWHSGA